MRFVISQFTTAFAKIVRVHNIMWLSFIVGLFWLERPRHYYFCTKEVSSFETKRKKVAIDFFQRYAICRPIFFWRAVTVAHFSNMYGAELVCDLEARRVRNFWKWSWSPASTSALTEAELKDADLLFIDWCLAKVTKKYIRSTHVYVGEGAFSDWASFREMGT